MKPLLRVAASLVIVLTAFAANGATYYIDAALGKDEWSGTQASPTQTSGPWQSLRRIQQAALLPGDRIILKCGSTWREPLVLPGSGTAANPIEVMPSEQGCLDKPAIDGSLTVPMAQWSLHSGSIYVAKLPLNLVPNGFFSTGTTSWRTWTSQGDSRLISGTSCPSSDGCLALTPGGGSGPTLVISPGFALQDATHTLTFRMNAPSGVPVRVVVRKDGAPWSSIGADMKVQGSGSWQSYSIPVEPAGDIPKARVDFEVPSQRSIQLDEVLLTPEMEAPLRASVSGGSLVLARHPNPGNDARFPSSPYLLNATDSDMIMDGSRTGSTFVTAGSDLRLPSGGSLTPGLRIILRTNAWLIEERSVSSVSGNRVVFSAPTSYPLRSGWGYLLTGALWMLDSPGEWHYDAARRSLYVWMPDGGHPGNRVSLDFLDTAVNLSGLTGVTVDGISISNARLGLNLRNSSSVMLKNLSVENTIDEGVDAAASSNATVQSSQFIRTGRDAILGVQRDGTPGAAVNLRILDNTVVESGVRVEHASIKSLPIRSQGALYGGPGARIVGNRIRHSGYGGIRSGVGSLIQDNVVEQACLIIDDCGAIYLRGAGNNSIVTGNLILSSIGNVHGKPSNYTQAQGIYLDDHTSGATVSDNVVVDSDHGIQIHNASGNTIERNTLFGNRRFQLWLQADTTTSSSGGDVFSNSIRSNLMVPLGSEPSLHQQSSVGDTRNFATYELNHYSTLVAPTIALESGATGVQTHTFPQWQTAVFAGVSRNLDVGGTQTSVGENALFRVAGANLISNGDFATSSAGWASWSPLATNFHQSVLCPLTNCLTAQAGPAQSLVYSPNFSVTKDAIYRVTFDLRTATDGQATVVGLRRGGGGTNGYEWLSTAPQTFSGTTAWKRHSFTVKATKSVQANDPSTLDAGARIDFQLAPGQRVWVDNVEIVQLVPAGASLRMHILSNAGRAPSDSDCPDASSDTVFCSKYVRFSDGGRVSWPYSLPPGKAEAVYSLGDTLVDADADGIGDYQDTCSGSAIGSQVNSIGCSLDQAIGN